MDDYEKLLISISAATQVIEKTRPARRKPVVKIIQTEPEPEPAPAPAPVKAKRPKKPLEEQKQFKAGIAKVKDTLAKGKAENLVRKAIAKYRELKALTKKKKMPLKEYMKLVEANKIKAVRIMFNGNPLFRSPNNMTWANRDGKPGVFLGVYDPSIRRINSPEEIESDDED